MSKRRNVRRIFRRHGYAIAYLITGMKVTKVSGGKFASGNKFETILSLGHIHPLSDMSAARMKDGKNMMDVRQLVPLERLPDAWFKYYFGLQVSDYVNKSHAKEVAYLYKDWMDLHQSHVNGAWWEFAYFFGYVESDEATIYDAAMHNAVYDLIFNKEK